MTGWDGVGRVLEYEHEKEEAGNGELKKSLDKE